MEIITMRPVLATSFFYLPPTRHVHYADGRPGNGKITGRQILNITRAEALNSSLSGVLDKPSRPNANPSLARHSSVQGRYGGTGVHDQSRRVAIEHGRDFEMIA